MKDWEIYIFREEEGGTCKMRCEI